MAPLSGTLPPSISCSLSQKYNESIVHAISTDLNILKNDVRKIKKKCLGFFIVRLSIASMLRLSFRQRLLGSGVLNHDLAGQQNDKGLDDPSREDRLRVGAGQHLKCENSNRPIRGKCRIFSFSCHVRLLNVFFCGSVGNAYGMPNAIHRTMYPLFSVYHCWGAVLELVELRQCHGTMH